MTPRKAGTRLKRPGASRVILDVLGDERFAREARLRREYRSQPEGFIRWCEEETFILDAQTNKWQLFRFEPWQLDEVRRVLDPDPMRYRTLVWCWPRRHGKSEVSARYDIWRSKNFDYQNCVIGSNSEDQTLSTAYQIAVDTIRNSPKLRSELDSGEIEVLATEIKFTRTHSSITGIPTREASAYGQKINVGHVTELCKARDDSLYQVIASSTGDAHLGVAVCDSNVGSIDNVVKRLIDLAESGEDPTIGVSYICYKDLDDAIRRGPRWISADWLRSRSRQMTPGEFRRNHLNLPATVGAKLFTEAQVDACFSRVPPGWTGAASVAQPPPAGADQSHPGAGVPQVLLPQLPRVFSASDFRRLRSIALYGVLSVGGGLDRALPFARRDRTFWASGAKLLFTPEGGCATPAEVPVYDEDGEVIRYEAPDPWIYVLLNLVEFPWSNASAIQRAVEADVERYEGLANISFEQYQAGDLYDWAMQRGWPCVLTHFTGPVQLEAYSDLYRVIASGRFYASLEHWILGAELRNVEENESSAMPTFGGPRVMVQDPDGNHIRIKDDSVEAVVNLFIALRGEAEIPQGPPVSVRGHSVFALTE